MRSSFPTETPCCLITSNCSRILKFSYIFISDLIFSNNQQELQKCLLFIYIFFIKFCFQLNILTNFLKLQQSRQFREIQITQREQVNFPRHFLIRTIIMHLKPQYRATARIRTRTRFTLQIFRDGKKIKKKAEFDVIMSI